MDAMKAKETTIDVERVNKTSNKVLYALLTAVAYGVASFFIVVVNKVVLTTYRFPSAQFLGIGQMVATVVVLAVAKRCGVVKFPDLTRDVPRKIWPLPLFYLGNLVCGLGGTKQLSLPMFTVLRRFSILMTMIAEYYVLGVRATSVVKLSVAAMVGGAVVAAGNDLAFDAVGYAYVLSNDLFTAANGVFLKRKLDSKDLGKYGLMYYNCAFALAPASLAAWWSGDVVLAYDYAAWTDPAFALQFGASCVMGFVLIYATMLCTAHNSALTTTIVGCLKNVIITYVGMFVGGDYLFSVANFVGLNISVLGSVVYAAVTFSEPGKAARAGPESPASPEVATTSAARP